MKFVKRLGRSRELGWTGELHFTHRTLKQKRLIGQRQPVMRRQTRWEGQTWQKDFQVRLRSQIMNPK